MKYFFTACFIVGLVFAINAQVTSSEWHFTPPGLPAPISGKPAVFIDGPLFPSSLPGENSEQNSNQEVTAETRGYTSVVIGNTYFDLQTNASVCNTFFKNTDGKLYAVWNFAPYIDPNFTSRGTGYNYFSNGTWQPEPLTRIESSRTGWPNILISDQNKEYILCHNLQFGGLQATHRTPPGSGTWVEQLSALPSPNFYGSWWPRVIKGDTGFGNFYLHAIALTLPVSNGGEWYHHMDGALLYYRSKDDGLTWDKVNVLISGIDSTQYSRIRPDNYALDAHQNNVAIVTGGFGNDVILLISPDNGISWQKTIVQDFPIENFYDQITDINNDGVADWVNTNDGSLAVLIDNSGTQHVWVGYNQIYNPDSTDGAFSFNTTANGILYWNSDMVGQPMKLITGAIDLNGNDTLDIGGIGFFNAGLATHPSGGTDGSGHLWLTYSAVAENGVDADGKAVRHTYIIGSDDGGITWSVPYDVTNELNAEGIYGSVARSNDDNIRLIYQKDYCAGISTTPGFPDPCNSGKLSQILYVEAPALEILNGVGNEDLLPFSAINLFPNPTTGDLELELPIISPENGSVSVSDLSGRILIMQDRLISPSESLDLSGLLSGAYVIKVSTNSIATSSIVIVH